MNDGMCRFPALSSSAGTAGVLRKQSAPESLTTLVAVPCRLPQIHKKLVQGVKELGYVRP